VRYVNTIQTISGRVSLPDPRNTTASGASLPDGSRYPSIVNIANTRNVYSEWLPAATLAYDIGEHAVVRVAGSRTMTRPDPSAQLPGVNFRAPRPTRPRSAIRRWRLICRPISTWASNIIPGGKA
jgi:outer membrane receptor protein involved in Fe transport